MYATDIEEAVKVLERGGVILYPTDTVWGLGCDATNSDAVQQIFSIKQRSHAQSMLTLVDGFDMLAPYLDSVPEIAMTLDKSALKPLSIVYPNARGLASNLIDTDGSAGIRVVNNIFCQQLIATFGKPIVSTSANISGEKTPAMFDEISEPIKNAVDFIVGWRQNDCNPAQESSIIKLMTDGTYIIIR